MDKGNIVESLKEINEITGHLETADLLRGIINAIRSGVLLIDRSGTVTAMNEMACKLTGYTEAELLGQSIACIFPPTFLSVLLQDMHSIGENDRVPYRKMKVTDRDHQEFLAGVSGSALPAENLILLNIEDLSEQEKHQEELKLVNHRMSSLVDNLSIYLWSLDENLRFVTANNAAKGIFKKSFDYDFVPGDHVMELYYKRYKTNTDLWLKKYKSVLATGKSQFFELSEVFYGRFSHIMVELHPIKTFQEVKGISCLVKNDTNIYLKNRLNQALSNFKSRVLNLNSINELLWAITDEVISKLHLEDAVILMKKGNILQTKTAYGSKRVGSRRIDSPLNIRLGQGVTGSVALSGKPEIINDVSNDERYFEVHFQAGSEIVVPILVDGEVVGLINCESRHKNFFRPIHLEILTEVASVAAEKLSRIIADRRLRRMEELNKAVLNSTPNSYLLLNPRMEVESFNHTAFQAFEALNGRLEKGADILDFVPEEYLAEFQSYFKSALAGKLVTSEREFEHPQFGKAWLKITFSPAINNSRSIFGVTLIILDTTRQKQDELLILQQNQELRKTNQELDKFVYSVSHDLRSPVSSVMGITSLIAMSDELKEIQEYNELIADSMERMDNFIRNILDYSRNSRVDLEYEEFSITRMVDDILADHSYVDGFRNIEIKKEVSVKTVFLDRQRIGIILRNLISNAVKYHDNRKDDRYIRIAINADDESYLIRIEDNGQGIAKAYLSDLFNMFYTANLNSKGSGIGLYIVKEAVTALQGEIKVTSELQKGTAFEVIIPRIS